MNTDLVLPVFVDCTEDGWPRAALALPQSLQKEQGEVGCFLTSCGPPTSPMLDRRQPIYGVNELRTCCNIDASFDKSFVPV